MKSREWAELAAALFHTVEYSGAQVAATLALYWQREEEKPVPWLKRFPDRRAVDAERP